MKSLLRRALRMRGAAAPWNGVAPVREELFSAERLEQHAESLAAAQPVDAKAARVVSLRNRLDDNAAVLLGAYRVGTVDLESGGGVVPAAEWLLDNYHVVEEQIRQIRDDLPPGYYRQLPKLAAGPFAGYPRVFGIAWAFVAHTDSHLDPDILRRFIAAYQRVQPLTIGELWAVAITLRIVLVENLRRLTDQITAGRAARADAEAFANQLLTTGAAHAALDSDITTRSHEPLSEIFAAHLGKRLRDQDPRTTPALAWLGERLGRQGTTIEEVVLHAQQRQGASNVSVRNVITSMRAISDLDWAELFESVSLVDFSLRGGSDFAAMDFATRNLYRSAIEVLARDAPMSELDIAGCALAASRSASCVRARDPGYHLIAEGRAAFERVIGFRAPALLRLSRFTIRLGIVGYIGVIVALTLAILACVLALLMGPGTGIAALVMAGLVGVLPATEVATMLVNRVITRNVGATLLPGMALASGVPEALRTLVAVPTLLTGEADLLEQIERLEIHFLSGRGGDMIFALLSDGADARQETMPGDAPLLAAAAAAIAALNRRHGPGPAGDRFLMLHRRRIFNAGEGRWMGWERKRGKLHELNRLLRGATDTGFVGIGGAAPAVPDRVRYVITLDVDTMLPRDAAIRLIGKMAHPLNRPIFDSETQMVVRGHGILQPRVTPLLPGGGEGSRYQQVISGPGGMDPYAAAVSDVYQDLFGEGSFTGKGIYDVDAIEAALANRIPDNTMLSHDLFEGVFARAGLASDVEVVEAFPTRYDVVARRQHRWVRGDWQLLPWLAGRGRGMPAVGRGKMLDNLRRSLLAPATLAALALSWLLPIHAALIGILLICTALALPAFLPVFFAVLPRRRGLRLRTHAISLGGELRQAAWQTLFSVAFLADLAWQMGDAIGRTLIRLFGSHRHLLEWTTAAHSARARSLFSDFFRRMAGGTLLAAALAAAAIATHPASWILALPFALIWLAAPLLAMWASRPRVAGEPAPLASGDVQALRLIARATWRYFEVFVTPADNFLPPDNFQETPKPVAATRTSPTNIGLYLLAAVAARDFGWAGTAETLERLEATFAILRELPRLRGHFFNWYDTRDLRVLEPAYVSSVDSGNLAGHLITLANACEDWRLAPVSPRVRAGLDDDVRLAMQALRTSPAAGDGFFEGIFDEIAGLLAGSQPIETVFPALNRLAEKATKACQDDNRSADLSFWVGALRAAVIAHERDLRSDVGDRLAQIAATARALALAMDFGFLFDPDRQLLSIGFSLPDNRLDVNCYDLLASEARLASLFAIAKGDVATKHWFRLDRSAIPVAGGSALVSWSGSMFEYLMPALVMRAPAGSLLAQTDRLVVRRQIAYGKSLGIPWGISESAFDARDLEFTYQYSNFGVPGLGLKRGLSENQVIAPYATGLAAMVDPAAALRNYAHLAALGAAGRYGFYEALDFTRSRLADGERVAIVRSYMAHHQGMTIVAIANILHDGEMRSRFHREPMIRASELLLQERMPRDVAILHPQAGDMKAAAGGTAEAPAVRHVTWPSAGPAITHLLSNGRYAVMLTAGGGGYSHWRDLAVTRWREDATRDTSGFLIFLRDVHGGAVWSAGRAHGDAVIFGEDHAEFVHHDGTLSTTMDVLVSGEADGEVRRISLINSGRRAHEIELTSFGELVLTSAAADTAHPAFAKMFVETSYHAEYGALVATRRPRTPQEPPIWVGHFAVVEGEITAAPQYETDRARFLGRSRTIRTAAAMAEGAVLSNTVGTVLDPVFSLRVRVSVPAGRVTRIAFWTVVAPSKAELLDLVDQHHDRSAYDRAKTLAWTQAQVQLRHLGVTAGEAADFQRMAAPIMCADRRFRAPADAILRGAGMQSGLWMHGISGDLPIVLLRIDDAEDIVQVHQLLRAHEYWRMKRLPVDLVIVNERASSYVQDLQIAIETALRSRQARPLPGAELARGAVFALRADLMSGDSRALLQSIARVALIAARGPLADQLLRVVPAAAGRLRRLPVSAMVPVLPAVEKLEFFNGLGGFADDGREYVTILDGGVTTPAPWINVIANRAFGFQVSADGAGFTWAENSRENQITAWSNDPVADPCGEAIFIRDEISSTIVSATAQPIRDDGRYTARHGFGYSRFAHEADGLDMSLLHYVPMAEPVKISRLTIRNVSGRPRRLSASFYVEWVLGTSRGASAPYLVTSIDPQTGALLARNPWSTAFPGRVAFADLAGRQTAWTGDRTEFLGRDGELAAPAALLGTAPLSGAVGAGFDPCGVLQTFFEIAAGETVEIVALLGACDSAAAASALVARMRAADLDAVLAEVTGHWRDVLGAVRVSTPDRAMDIMLNGWLLYQTLACRVWARSAFYQASGAYGFRDQLQDGMALSFSRPQETRAHLLRAAGRQFVAGDVQHWWLPQSGQGVRTRISDDRVWLAFATATYVVASGDAAVLDVPVGFLEGPVLGPDEHDVFFQPMVADSVASLFEHCALGLDGCLALTGTHGLPLMGTGDWNDGMNRVGEGGAGESVWLGWFLVRAIALFAKLADGRDDARAARWRAHAVAVCAAIERDAWDGEWYRRATYDDGTWLGGKDSEACRIDAIAQSWAVLSGGADPARAAMAMASFDRLLVRPGEGISRLFWPPFDETAHDPGYIKGYPPGLRENGGQYSHAAMWAVMAYAKLGDGGRAASLFALLNPINHAGTADAVGRYKVEPYVVAADVYSVAPHVGRGGWTWYTGSSGWMYRAGVEGILGIRREGDFLVIEPCIPNEWPGFEATIEVKETRFKVRVERGIAGGPVRLPLDGGTYDIVVTI